MGKWLERNKRYSLMDEIIQDVNDVMNNDYYETDTEKLSNLIRRLRMKEVDEVIDRYHNARDEYTRVINEYMSKVGHNIVEIDGGYEIRDDAGNMYSFNGLGRYTSIYALRDAYVEREMRPWGLRYPTSLNVYEE